MTWDKRVPEGPYFVSEDAAEDTVDHKNSGLAMVDTGRSMDWPIARLCEWPTAQFIAASWDMYQALIEVRSVIEKCGYSKDATALHGALQAIDAAIAKAEGKNP